MEWMTLEERRKIEEREKIAKYHAPIFEQRRKSWTFTKAKENVIKLIEGDFFHLMEEGRPTFVVEAAYKIVTQNEWDDCLEILTEDIKFCCDAVLRYLDLISDDLHVSLFFDEKQQKRVRLRLRPNY